MLELVDPGLSLRRQVDVCVNERRHDGLAAQVDAGRAIRDLYVRPRTDLSEASVLDDEHRVLDGRAAVSDDQAGPLEDRRVRSAAGVRTAAGCQKNESQRQHGRKGDYDARVTMT